MSTELKGVWAVLREIKKDLKDFDMKWERHIQTASADRERLVVLCQQMDNLERLLVRGNGQKPILSQLEALKSDYVSLKAAAGMRLAPEELKRVKEELKKARYLAIAKVFGVIALAIPGLLALLGAGG